MPIPVPFLSVLHEEEERKKQERLEVEEEVVEDH